jgi:hypothetical protein
MVIPNNQARMFLVMMREETISGLVTRLEILKRCKTNCFHGIESIPILSDKNAKKQEKATAEFRLWGCFQSLLIINDA